MPQAVTAVNPEGFFDAFDGSILFRAVDHATQQASTFYGEAWLYLPELQRLNLLGRSIYFCVNDPGGLAAKSENFSLLRCIYQDAEPGKTADPAAEPVIAGQQAHFTIQTSPGRFQRFWLCAPFPAAYWPRIQQRMVEFHGHDHECATGPAQIMRAPGFLNTKPGYDPPPLVRIIHDRSHLPKLTVAAIEKHFALADAGPPIKNAANTFERVGGPNAEPRSNVHSLDKERAKRSNLINRQHSDEQQAEKLHDVPSQKIELSKVLDKLAMLDPSMGRNEWRKVGGALHYMFQGDDAGFDMFETWSAMGANFKGGMDCMTLWNGLNTDHPTPSHWLTLCNMAGSRSPGAAEIERHKSPAFEGLRQRLDPYLDFTPLVINYPERRRVEQGFSAEPERNSKANALCHYHDQGISVRYDDFARCVRLNGVQLSREMLLEQASVAYDQGWRPSLQELEHLTNVLALDSRYNPAQEYLNSLRGRWDGVERLPTLFQRHLGAADSPSIRELGPLLLYAAVRRIHDPGTKFDLMPILQGKQELGKSSLFRLLCPNEAWFLNSLRLDLEEKRLYAQIQGKIFIEFGELSGKKTAEVEKIKSFVTQQTDEFVQNYATTPNRFERIAVFVGTTNEHRFLRDLTGNRRFPVIPVAKELNWEALLAEREQLWAEAVTMEELTGDLRLSAEGKADMERIQQDRIDRDTTVEGVFDELNAFPEGYIHRNSLWVALGYAVDRDREKKLSATARYSLSDLEKMLNHAGWSINETTRHDCGKGRGHFRKTGRHLVKEIVYANGKFTYKADLQKEADKLLGE